VYPCKKVGKNQLFSSKNSEKDQKKVIISEPFLVLFDAKIDFSL
jgi:hypothetical protein